MTARFQYQLGSIGASPVAFAPALALTGFNTSLVRLAPRRSGHRHLRARSFQYQLGSIGACPGEAGRRRGAAFQYQLGSIGAPDTTVKSAAAAGVSIPAWFDWREQKWVRHESCQPRFNTSLVRLARGGGTCDADNGSVFQYQLGSIGAAHPRTGRVGSAGFQYQLGSIGARGYTSRLVGGVASFNTSLVRLAPPSAHHQGRRWSCFNTSLVRLALLAKEL